MPTLKFDWWRSNKVAIHGWGFEVWMVNDSRYCGKKLFIDRGKRCSMHYHKEKHETFFINQGKVQVVIWNLLPGKHVPSIGPFFNKILDPGEKISIEPYQPHRFIGLDPINEIIEISTEHNEEDTYRIEDGD